MQLVHFIVSLSRCLYFAFLFLLLSFKCDFFFLFEQKQIRNEKNVHLLLHECYLFIECEETWQQVFPKFLFL